MDKACENTSGSIVDRFVKPRASKVFGHPEYSLDGTGPSIAVSGPHEEFFRSTLGIWIGKKLFQMKAAGQSGCTKNGGL